MDEGHGHPQRHEDLSYKEWLVQCHPWVFWAFAIAGLLIGAATVASQGLAGGAVIGLLVFFVPLFLVGLGRYAVRAARRR